MSAYSTQDAFDIYVYYLALKRHFTSNYDYFKYNGKVKTNAMAFENRKDKFFFYKLSKKRDARDIILANMLTNPNAWAGQLLDDKAEAIYTEWAKRRQSLTYQFKSDISEMEEDFNSNFHVEGGQHPRLLKLYMMNRISLETLVIVCDITGCLNYWEKNISDTIVFPDINKLVRKYHPFIEYDKLKLKKILLDNYQNIS
jgi:hypothetical protein|tara:strand:- start:152 stop:748 length:597 start_codon:yes stop_codon:yes gene_type:complete